MYKRIQKLSAALVAIIMTTLMLSTSFAQQSISETHWADEKMLRWSALGVIRGYDSEGLRPDNSITRAEVTTIINKVFGFTSKSTTQFIDVKSSAWYADELLKAREANIT